MNKKIVSIITIAMALLMMGCANRDMQAKNSGFLKNYDKLQDHEQLETTRIHIAPGADFTAYENIYVEQVQVISAIPEKDWTPEQKILFEKISTYLTNGYKKSMLEGTGYRLVEDKKTPKTIVFEGAISAVEVHFDDMQWYQFTPITLGVTAVARGTYIDASVRILGEGRFTDAKTGKVLLRAMSLQKGEEVGTDADRLVFKDLKPGLDAWLKNTDKNLVKLRKGVIKYEKNK